MAVNNLESRVHIEFLKMIAIFPHVFLDRGSPRYAEAAPEANLCNRPASGVMNHWQHLRLVSAHESRMSWSHHQSSGSCHSLERPEFEAICRAETLTLTNVTNFGMNRLTPSRTKGVVAMQTRTGVAAGQ